KGLNSLLCGWILRDRHQNSDPSHPVRLLRARNKRPCCRAAEKRDELAPLQSIEWHLVTQPVDSITDWRGSVRGSLQCGNSLRRLPGLGRRKGHFVIYHVRLEGWTFENPSAAVPSGILKVEG